MFGFRNTKIRTKLLIAALAMAFIPATIIGIFAWHDSREALQRQAFNQLESVREIKKAQLESFFAERKADMLVLSEMVANVKQNATQNFKTLQAHQKAQIESYFTERLSNISVLSKNETIIQFLAQFESAFHKDFHEKGHEDEHEQEQEQEQGASQVMEGEAWQTLKKKFGNMLTQYLDKYGYDDLLLIAPDGDVIYSVAERSDLGQNLLNGALKNSPLKKAFQKGRHGISIQDFAPYAPADNQYVAFLTAPVFHSDKLIGVLASSLSPDNINAIIQRREGMGQTGGSYLVGKSDDQTAYRSQRITKGKFARIGDAKSGEDIDKALAGQSGVAIQMGSTGVLELSVYAPLEIQDLNWCIITTMTLEELLSPKGAGGQRDFFAHYIRQHSYYDLLLIHPQGDIFYTVLHQLDYGTNILNGKYANSGLGDLVQNVLQTKAYGIGDFAPYAPSNNEPAAFIAQPLLDHNGTIELIIALQLSDKAITQIMYERAGMGKSGETYLVGSDKLMRSDSYQDPENHSIIGSFANPTQNAIKTDASRAALEKGETGTQIIKNYRNVTVLSAYTPLKVGDTTWAVIAEIDADEAFQAITHQQRWFGFIALCIAIITLLLVIYYTKFFTRPLLQINSHLKTLAQGKMVEDDIDYQEKDEIGELVKSAQTLKEGIKNTIEQANAIAAGDYSNEVKRLSDQDQLGEALIEMVQRLRDITLISQTIAAGDYSRQIEIKGERDILGQALNQMTERLQKVTDDNQQSDWLKTGQTQLNDLMSGEQDIVTMAKKIISFLTTYVEADVGLFYLFKDNDDDNKEKPYLQIIATYAYTNTDDNQPDKYWLGDGLIGQAAIEQKTLSRIHTEDEHTYIRQSSLAVAVPHQIQIIPFMYENALKGIIEIGFSKIPSPIRLAFLEQIKLNLGIAVNTAQSRTQMTLLLEQTQKQTKELQAQKDELQNKQEELQQSNEELQTQSEELQTQSEELQTQQEELRQVNEELEERTKELERQQNEIRQKNEALEESQVEMEKARAAMEIKAKELELASKYKSEFLANMSHELRTPLNSLLILAQLLTRNKNGNMTEDQVKYAKTIYSAGSDLLKLINEILDLSKVEAGKVEVHAENLPLSHLMEKIEHKFTPLAENKGLTFNIQQAENAPSQLHTDGHRLEQIINNLLSNAFKFTSQGEVKLSIQRPSDKDLSTLTLGLNTTNSVAISVTDSGIGIPKDKQQVVFEAFQQADGTTSRRFGGTGLGLSISRQLARMLGGDLQLHSEEGKGSTFTIYLPEHFGVKPSASAEKQQTTQTGDEKSSTLAPAPATATATATATAPAASGKSDETVIQTADLDGAIADDRDNLQPGDQFILIIEDDRKFSHIIMDLARDKNFKYLIAEDGKTGLQLAQQYKPNAIILDVGLPQMDGWTVMEKLKDDPDTRHIPVHFMSGYDNSVDAKQMGAIGYLQKPVNLEQLGNAFKNIKRFISQTVKNLLLVVDDKTHQQQIVDLVGDGKVQVTVAKTSAEAFQYLKKGSFECLIIDVDAEAGASLKLLESLYKDDHLSQIPVIISAERDLTPSEETTLHQYDQKLTVKTVRSPARLLDEATLFLHQVQAHLPEEKQQMLDMVHDKEALLKDKKVLLVDDDVRNVFALMNVLEESNMEVIVGNTGQEGLDLLAQHQNIDIVLMDIMMPEMDGYEAMRKIREQHRFRKLPIIALTAKAMKGDKAKCLEAGANDYLSKPVDTDKLLSLMRVWLYQ